MQPVAVPEIPRLRGEKAVEALEDFINELEEEIGKELTEKQTNALIRIAKGLISSIEAETQMVTPNKDIKERRFVTQLKKQLRNTILNTLPF